MEREVKEHKAANVNQCTDCHDPHNKNKTRDGGVKAVSPGGPGPMEKREDAITSGSAKII